MYPGVHAEQHPDQPALVMATSGAQLTFAEFEANANRLAHLYRSVGLRRGDHVAIFMENNLRYFETMSAAERSGLYYTCINSYLTPEEVAYIVDNCDARLLIASVATVEVAEAAAAMTPKVETFLCVDADTEIGRFRPYDESLAAFPTDAHRRRAARRGDALLLGHDRPAEGDPAAAARRPPQRAAAAVQLHHRTCSACARGWCTCRRRRSTTRPRRRRCRARCASARRR